MRPFCTLPEGIGTPQRVRDPEVFPAGNPHVTSPPPNAARIPTVQALESRVCFLLHSLPTMACVLQGAAVRLPSSVRRWSIAGGPRDIEARGTCGPAVAVYKGKNVKPLQSRFAGLLVFAAVFLGANLLLRVALCAYSFAQIDASPWAFAKIYLVGQAYDLVAYFYCALIVALFALLAPDKVFRSTIHRRLAIGLYLVGVCVLLLDVAAQCLFWEEFEARYNFVAVDYLVYTHEVLGNIVESYPVPLLLSTLFVATAAIVFLTRKCFLKAFESPSSFRDRLVPGLVHLAVPVLALIFVDQSLSNITDNHYNNELSKNGIHSLFAAFRSNIIDYDRFYITQDDKAAFMRLRKLLKTENARFVSAGPFSITRQITHSGPEKRHNVVIILMESLGANFLGAFGDPRKLTPNLDALCKESLLFRRFYATGTRTVRALEAIVLSIPPTPGRSVVKRPGSGNLFSIGSLLCRRGYDNTFLYAGYGYFDNMNAFFDGNGFRHVDQWDLQEEEVTFSNAWGVCDEDILNKALKECDQSHGRGKWFASLVLTCSNHRPYTYPQKIDIPSGTTRLGAVKYADYAIGGFIRKAKTRPWFDNTIFVIVADHCASSAGKTEVPVEKYHIPLLVYAPKLIKPGNVDKIASQIDLAPTLLGLLNASYESKFFGRDILKPGQGRALLGNYQKVGLLCNGTFALLLPQKESRAYRVGGQGGQRRCPEDQELLLDMVSYYQSVAYLLRNHLYLAR